MMTIEVLMTTITLTPDIEVPLVKQAEKLGTTPELLALESLRRMYSKQIPDGDSGSSDTLFDFLAGHIGTVSGSTEAFSVNCGERFVEGLLEKQQQNRQ
jgi:hypothetical protein